MSLQFVRLIPHSKFVPTSFTSSLKRFNALMFPVKITMPSRIRRALSLRFTFPVFTMAPATRPTLVMLNTSRTSIVAVTCSLQSRRQHTFHGSLHLFNGIVDDRILGMSTPSFCQFGGRPKDEPGIRTMIASRSGSQRYIRFGDSADAFVNNVYLYLLR